MMSSAYLIFGHHIIVTYNYALLSHVHIGLMWLHDTLSYMYVVLSCTYLMVPCAYVMSPSGRIVLIFVVFNMLLLGLVFVKWP